MDFAVRYVDACDVMHDPAGRDRQEVPDAERTKLEKQYAPELVSTFITAVSESRSQQKR